MLLMSVKDLEKKEFLLILAKFCNKIPNALKIVPSVMGIFKSHKNVVKDDKFQFAHLTCLTEAPISRVSDLLPLQEHFHMHTSLVPNNTNKIINYSFCSIITYLSVITSTNTMLQILQLSDKRLQN